MEYEWKNVENIHANCSFKGKKYPRWDMFVMFDVYSVIHWLFYCIIHSDLEYGSWRNSFGQDFLGMFALGRGVLRFWRKLASLEKHVSQQQLICQPLITHSWSTSGLIFTLGIVNLFLGQMLRSGLNQSRLGTKIGHPATCSIPF